MPLRYLVDLNRQVLPETTESDFKFRYIDISQVTSQGEVLMPDQLTLFSEAASRARRIAQPGDTVVSTVRPYLRAIAQVPRAVDPLVFSTGFAVLAPRSIDHRFLAYTCRAEPFVSEVVARSTGVSYPAINGSDILDIAVGVPGELEQRRIADFLDDRVARIDRIIANRREQISAAEEARDEYVRELITTGGGETVESGIESMPRIGSGWGTPRVSHVFRTGSGSTPPSEKSAYYDGDVPWVNTGDIRDGVLTRTTRTLTDHALDDFSTLVRYPKGSLVIAMYGQGATRGRVALLDLEACVNQACCVLRADDELTRWAFYWFKAHKRHVVQLALGSGQPNLSQDIVRSVRISVAPEPERARILQAIVAEEVRTDQFARTAADSIDLLTEYKSSLITAAVTGELDVTTAGSGVPA